MRALEAPLAGFNSLPLLETPYNRSQSLCPPALALNLDLL